jgi:hypothetical protein
LIVVAAHDMPPGRENVRSGSSVDFAARLSAEEPQLSYKPLHVIYSGDDAGVFMRGQQPNDEVDARGQSRLGTVADCRENRIQPGIGEALRTKVFRVEPLHTMSYLRWPLIDYVPRCWPGKARG